MGRPIVDAVMLRGRGELDMLGRQVDNPVIRAALVVAAGRGVVVEIRAHPPGCLNQSFQCLFQSYCFTGLYLDFPFQMTVFDAAGNDDFVFSRIQCHEKFTALGVPLVHAAVCPVLRAEIGRLGIFNANELCLAWDTVSRLVGNGKLYA